jgi:hypothetical protein
MFRQHACGIFLALLAACPLMAAAQASGDPLVRRFQDNLEKAKAGDAQAQYDTGMAHFYGKGTGLDNKAALSWFQKAAGAGHPKAQYQLGEMLLNGVATERAPAQAAKLIEQAAGSGYAPAQYRLGVMYANGQGVSAHPGKAVDWLTKAQEGGYARAAQTLAEVKARTPEPPPPPPEPKKAEPAKPDPKKPEPSKEAAAPVAAAPAAAKPASPSIRKTLLGSKWYDANNDADWLPSGRMTCKDEAERSVCLSAVFKKTENGFNVGYRTQAVLSGFDDASRAFKLAARTEITEAAPVPNKLPGGPPPPALGWTGSEQSYDCRYDGGYVYCAQGGKDVRRFANMTKDEMDAQGYWDEFKR